MATPGFSLAQRLRAGETVYTAWCGLASPLITDVMAREGFSAVTIDQQHGMWDPAATITAITGIRAGGAAPIVRVPLEDFGGVSRALDWGAEGIIMPMINNAADAKRFVGVAKFPPMGERSWGPHRATLLAGVPDQKVYLREANDATITLAMIETREAMDNLDAIAAVPGIDVLFVGPSDLSITLSKGQLLDPHSAEVEAALDRILAAAKKAGKIAGLYCIDAGRALATAKRGFRFLAVGSDLGFLRAGFAPQVKQLKGG
jgi:4-hydroxy-2-oxoheptanedioate aldolase